MKTHLKTMAFRINQTHKLASVYKNQGNGTKKIPNSFSSTNGEYMMYNSSSLGSDTQSQPRKNVLSKSSGARMHNVSSAQSDFF